MRFTNLISAVALFSVFMISIIGCSSGVNPVEPGSYEVKDENSIPDLASLGDLSNSIGLFGGYELIIDVDSLSADLIRKRQSSLGESYLISGKSYFDISPCTDCFKLHSLGYQDGQVIVTFELRHPFEKGDPLKPPTGKNRLDLDIFDPALIVVPKPYSTVNYSLLNIGVPDYRIANPDGYTVELSNVIDSTAAFPYVLVINDADTVPPSNTFNVLEMGGSAEFDVVFPLDSQVPPGQTLTFDLYLTFGYGASAVLATRFDPTYFNPEFNRKASWKVEVISPNGINAPQLGNTWDNCDSSTEYNVTVKVYDWQIGATVNPVLENPTDIYAASGIDHISLEIPGMANSAGTVSGNSYIPGGLGMPGSPLVYTIPVANSNLLTVGEYTGLVAVYDVRSPLDITDSRDFLINTPNGGQNMYPYEIPGYVTYQTFIATVVAGTCGPITGSIVSPSCPVTGLVNDSTVDFTVSASSASGGNPIVLYESDYDYDGTTFNTSASNTNGIFNNSGPFTVPNPCADNIPYGFTVAFRATDSCDPPHVTIFATCIVVVERCDTVCGPITGSIISPSCPVTGLTSGDEVDFVVSASSAGAGDIIVYDVDYDYDGVIFNPSTYSLTGDFNDVGPFIPPVPCYDNTPYDFTVAFRAIDNCDPPNETIFATCTVTVENCAPSGNLIWAKRAGGVDYDYGRAITKLSDNSVVITGHFKGTATFGKDETNQTMLTSDGDDDIFVAQYNPDGTLEWAKHAGGTLEDIGYGITRLSDDSTIITGTFKDAVSFGRSEPGEVQLTSYGANDIFIARYNTNGTLAWAKQAGGIDGDWSYAVTTLPDNTIVITGSFWDAATFGIGEPNETILNSSGNNDFFIARYNSVGSLMWAKKAGGSSGQSGSAINGLSDNSTVAVGYFSGSTTFGPGEPNQTILTLQGPSDVFIARFNIDGTLAWAKRAGGASSEVCLAVTKLSDNSSVISGYFNNSTTFGVGESNETTLDSAGNSDIFIARYNPDGSLEWAKKAGGTQADQGLAITVLPGNSTVICGYFNGNATFGQDDPNETLITSSGLDDIFIARYNPDGLLVWVKQAGGINDDWGRAITALSDNSIVVSGSFFETCEFGHAEPNETDLTADGLCDIFVARFEP